MFIIWGTKRSDRKLGRVADFCPFCDDARACRLIEVRMVSHLYYIPLGRGKVVGHLLWCEHCKDRFGTDPQRYTDVSKDRRASVEELTDATHPQLVDTIAQWIDLRERAERGEADEDERRRLIVHPFVSIAASVAQRCTGIHFDEQSVGWLLALVVVPSVILLVCSLWMTDDQVVGLAIASIFIVAILLIVSIARDATRFIRRRYWRYMVEFIAPLNPTAEELSEVVLDLKRNADTAALGKRINPNKLHRDITAYRDDRTLQV